MILRTSIAAGLVLLALTGCMSAISGSHPPKYYGLEYPYTQPAPCPAGLKEGLRLWPLSASSPFNREEMIVLGPSHQVDFSPSYRWVSLPGTMVSDALHRDLARDGLFPQIVESGDPFSVPLEMGGHIYDFSWQEGAGAGGRAVLDLEISLWRKEPKREVLFKKHYHFESAPASKRSADAFANAMSGLVKQLSENLEQDLCELSKSKGSSSRAGG